MIVVILTESESMSQIPRMLIHKVYMTASKSQEQNYKKLILQDFIMVKINALLSLRRPLRIQIHIESLQCYINLQDMDCHPHFMLHRQHM